MKGHNYVCYCYLWFRCDLRFFGINFAAMKIATVVGATVYNAVWAAPIAYAFTAIIAQFPSVAFIVALV